MTKEECAKDLMKFAAWYSTQQPLGWGSHYCGVFQEAARLLRGEPTPVYTGEVVLSKTPNT